MNGIEFAFDRFERADEGLAPGRLVVTHRDANGNVYAFHSPLEHGPVRCEWCETPGNRVYGQLEEAEPEDD